MGLLDGQFLIYFQILFFYSRFKMSKSSIGQSPKSFVVTSLLVNNHVKFQNGDNGRKAFRDTGRISTLFWARPTLRGLVNSSVSSYCPPPRVIWLSGVELRMRILGIQLPPTTSDFEHCSVRLSLGTPGKAA